jgi:hypothetical protein
LFNHLRTGDFQRSIDGYAELLPRAEKVLPAEHWHLAAIRGNYGEALYRAGRYAEAEPLIRAAFRVIKAQFGADDPFQPRPVRLRNHPRRGCPPIRSRPDNQNHPDNTLPGMTGSDAPMSFPKQSATGSGI